MINDVVTLPLTGLAGSIHEWLGSTIKRSGLPISVGLVLVAIKDLNLVSSHQENSAVATPLAAALHFGRSSPFDMKLA